MMNRYITRCSFNTLLLMMVTVSFFIPLKVSADPFAVKFADKPEHAVLFIIDGFSYKAVDRMELPAIKKMISGGAHVEKSYLPPAAHPHTGVYATLHTCSIPNPIMMAGTVFIREDTEYLPQCFFPGKRTAFVVNSLSYQSINRFYHFSYQEETDDAQSVKWALEFMDKAKPSFMRIHLQNPGGGGSASLFAGQDVPWSNDIWADNSPYRVTTQRADSLLAEFLNGLERLGVLDKTVIFVLGDHGQCDTGWHPFECIDSSVSTVVIWGAGIKKGVHIPYGELIDIVPTVCELMEVKPPSTCQGRAIVEALAGYSGAIPPRKTLIRDMLEQFVTFRKKMAEASYELEKTTSKKQMRYFTTLNRQIHENFYDINRFTDWPRFKTIEELLENNDKTMKQLDALLNDLKKEQ